jgi:hypothetical protein
MLNDPVIDLQEPWCRPEYRRRTRIDANTGLGDKADRFEAFNKLETGLGDIKKAARSWKIAHYTH